MDHDKLTGKIRAMRTLAENLLLARTAAGLSQAELAKRAKVSQQLVSQIERGENESAKTSTLVKLAEAAGVQVSDLVPEVLGGAQRGERAALMEKINQILTSDSEEALHSLSEQADLILRRIERSASK
ncbi:helix-turn-helix transcriptional regulator [Haematobacter sp.]|uniref:helix-turn-helix domain-containing protein n=1 Tax=Haematobacter sp. TaxID=2953762 RepID=UPI0028A8CF4E|nr:helix-turn-helix transcriptional regulator [Haematobacter sp.]